MEALRLVGRLLFSLPWLEDMAAYIHSLPLHPVFTSVHFILTAHALRREPGSVQFALDYPVASCVMTFVVASSGGILANIMTGAPPLECVANGWVVMAAVVSWYLIFLSPLDVCFYLCSAVPVQVALFTVEEVARAKKILSGVTAASALYPQSVLAMAVVGMLKGSGKKWGITWYRLVFQPQSASTMELKGLSLITKVAALLALLFSVNVRIKFCDQQQLLMVVALCLLAVRYKSLLQEERDFFNPTVQSLWRAATLLSITTPPQDDSISTLTAHKIRNSEK